MAHTSTIRTLLPTAKPLKDGSFSASTRPARQSAVGGLLLVAMRTRFPATRRLAHPPEAVTLAQPSLEELTMTCPLPATPVPPLRTSDADVPIVFEVHYPASQPGDTVLLVGNCGALGNWKLGNAVALHWSEGNWWRTSKPIPLPPGSMLEYKFVVDRHSSEGHQYTWQRGQNEVVQLPLTSENRVWILKDHWNASDHMLLSGAPATDTTDAFMSMYSIDDARVPTVAHIPQECFLCGRCAMPHMEAPHCPLLHPPRRPVVADTGAI